MVATQTIDKRRKTWLYFVAGLLLAAAAAILWVRGAQAAPSYDPWADSVTSASAVVLTPNNALGAPNGTSASLAGAPAVLMLDMGEGEEGTQTLRVHLTSINAQVNLAVDFMDANQAVIVSESRQLSIDPNPSVQNFAYNWANFGKAYRYVRLTSTAGAGVNVDAIEALGYIGSTPTQDTDGDGIPDRTEQVNGTNPLVPNPPANPGGGGGTTNPPGPIPGGGGGTTNNTTTINNPPAANNDKDGDGMADDWEAAHGLNPDDKTDADKDPDHDELSNLTEYRINSDPQKLDTDGDGMPDGWEYKHGLNLNVNDANGDPDGDYLTNLGEYRNGTDPNKADDLRKVFGGTCVPGSSNLTAMEWFWIILLVAGALTAWYLAWHTRKGRSTKSKETTTTTDKM